MLVTENVDLLWADSFDFTTAANARRDNPRRS